MQKFLFVPNDSAVPAYSRYYVNRDEFKKAANGTLRIFQLSQEGKIISEYNEADDGFETEVMRKY